MTPLHTFAEQEALQHVASGHVVFHSGAFGVMQGYTWQSDARMQQAEQDALATLEGARLIEIVPAQSLPGFYRKSASVRLTSAGERVLRQWLVRTLRSSA